MGSKKGVCLVIAWLVLLSSSAYAVPPVVSNVVAHQRTDGSKKVDIYYDLDDPDSPTLNVSVKVSSDGGATYAVPVTKLTGDVGANVPRSPGKHIVWESCGTDLPGAFGTNHKLCVTASDGVYPGQMIYIPAGSFLMGNNGAEPYSYSNELPQHSVYLSGYWIGKYEVTRGEYAQFMAAGGYSDPTYWSSAGWNWKVTTSRTEPDYWAAVQDWGTGSFTQTDNHPVVGVSYYEAEAFCNWAGGHLATEAQWEKAARWTGSYPNVYPWGNTWDYERCNNYYDHNAAGGGYAKDQTAPVGSYPSGASPYGCQDMAGNAWEWCKDWYSSTYYSQSPASDPQGPTSGSYRALRGGSWYYYYYVDYYDRCAFRYFNYPNSYWFNLGFRLAR